MERAPGTRAGITRDAVVAAALAVLRRQGLDAVSMRRVATELGVTPNTLYSHVPDKSALLDALLDAVLAGIAVPRRGGWRRRVERLMQDSRRALLANPDLAPLFLSRQTVGPNAMRLGEATLEQLARAGLTGEDAVRALQALLVHTIGGATFEVARRRDPDPAARRRRGRDAALALDPATHPRTRAAAEPMSIHDGEQVFQLGLRWLLDGVEAQVRCARS